MNTLVKKNNGRNPADPWMSDFFDVDNLFGRGWLKPFEKSLPAVNISENEKMYTVEVVAPGMKKDDFKVNVEEDILTISAESKHESTEEDKDRQYSRREYSHSSFTRSFRLPDNAKDDSIDAHYEDGVLKLTIPKSKTQVKASKQIKVN
jgi:HSP20 family protein